MKLKPIYLLLLLLPRSVFSQRRLSFGLEMTGVLKKSENIRPFDAYQLLGPMIQWSHRSDSNKLQLNIQSGFSYVKSSTYSGVYSVPLNAGADYQLPGSFFYGLTASAGTRFMFSGDAGTSRVLASARFGIYYDLFKGVPIKVGYERIGNSSGVFVQLIVYGLD